MALNWGIICVASMLAGTQTVGNVPDGVRVPDFRTAGGFPYPAQQEVESAPQDEGRPGRASDPETWTDLWIDFLDGIDEREALFGDWLGVRSRLEEAGIRPSLSWVQVLQGIADGGSKEAWRASGSVDLRLAVDTEQLGLWQNGAIFMHAETKQGRGVNRFADITAVNVDAVRPTADHDETALSQLWYRHSLLDDTLRVTLGKLNNQDYQDPNHFAGDHETQFLNYNFVTNPALAEFQPYTALGAVVDWGLTDFLDLNMGISGFESVPTSTGFTDLDDFVGWVVGTLKVEPFGLPPGHYRVGMAYTDKRVDLLNPTSEEIFFGGIGVRKTADDFLFYISMDQFLFTTSDSPQERTQGLGVFARFGVGDGDGNVIQRHYSFGFSGIGIVPFRPEDTFGFGYFYNDLSSDIPNSPVGSFPDDPSGFETYYNFQAAPWWQITPDFQFINNPQGFDQSDAFIVGVRSRIEF